MKSELSVLPPPEDRDAEARAVLRKLLDSPEKLDGCIVLMLQSNGTQALQSSSMTTIEKSFLLAFANAWLYRWFDPERE